MVAIPWVQALSLEGRVYGTQISSADLNIVTKGPFGNETTDGVIDTDEFDMLQTIPEQIVVMPVYFQVGMFTPGSVAAVNIVLCWGKDGVAGASPVTFTTYNMKTGSGNKSLCTVVGVADEGGTAITLEGIIFNEATTALVGAANTPQQIDIYWSAKEAAFTPVLEGKTDLDRQVAGWCCGQTAQGYMVYQYAELPISAVA